jgi:Nif-specific regulatory protein
MGSLPQPGLQEKLGHILAICRKMNSERELGPLLDLIAREATTLLDCDRASIFLLDHERNELWSKVALGSDEILRFDADAGIVGRAVGSGETVNVRDAYSDPRFYTGVDDHTGYRTRNLLALPLRKEDGEIIGAFEVLNKRIGVFTLRDEEALAALGGHAANAIATAQLIGELRRSQDELVEQNATLWREVEAKYASHGIIGAGPRIQQVVRLIERIRDSVVNVLITGESGTGKELVARALHFAGRRASGEFVPVNCGALVGTLLDSELFGHVRGAFTGAVDDRVGLVTLADGGTLFLDEIGELPLPLQTKLLGVLERRRVVPVGATRAHAVRIRVIAATHRDLVRRANQGLFRSELFYRIAVVRLRVPPLRERLDDLPLLVAACLKQLRARDGAHLPEQLSAVALAHLYAQPWPGNVRELFNAVEQAALQLPAPSVRPERAAWRPYQTTRAQALAEFDRAYFEALVRRSSNLSQLARDAGIDRRYLLRILERYGIDRPRARRAS